MPGAEGGQHAARMSQTTAKSAASSAKKGMLFVFPDLKLTSKEIYNAISLLLLALALYVGLYLSIGAPFLPNQGPAWAIIFIWFCASVLGFGLDRVHLPGPLGMIVAGIILRNVHGGTIIAGLKPSWAKEFRGIALAVIFLRSGLELDLGIFKRVGPAAIRLLFIPGICEAFFDGGIATALFGMPVTFAFALGFILKAIGPALVIQCMFEVQQKRLGLDKAIPATVVAAASFDDAIAITGYTIFINIAVTGSGGNLGWQIAHGPLSIVFGVIAGLGASLIACPTKLWNNAYKRTAVVFILALVMKFFFDKFNFTSGGALGSLTLGLVIKEMWAKGWPAFACVEGEQGPHLARSVEKHVRWFWRFIMCPLLFGIIGTQINFSTLPNGTIPKAVAIIFAGLGVRAPITYAVMHFSGFNVREKLFFALAWTPKATVQATLAALPLDQVNARIPKNSPEYAENARWAEDALVTAIFCILICGTVGTISIRWLAPYLLDKAVEAEDKGETEQGEQEERDLHRTLSGRYKNPAIDNTQPFGIESRRSQPLSTHDSTEGSVDDRAHLRQHNGLLAAYLDHFESIAEEVDHKGGRNEDHYLKQTAHRIKANVRSLRQKLVDEEGTRPPAHDVEGAQAFVRASADLRHRHGPAPAKSSDSSRQLDSSIP